MTPRRRALVTGGSRGIGRGVVLALSAAGFDVAATARTESGLHETVAQSAGTVVALIADIGDTDACAALPSRAAEALGGHVEVVVHAAGISPTSPVGELTLEAWDECLRVNVTAAFLLAREAGPAMVDAGWGRIINIGSLYSRMGPALTVAYTASKHALLGLTRVLANEFVRGGVTANTIVPGWVDTEMTRTEIARAADLRGMSDEKLLKNILRTQPIGRMVTTAEVAALVAFLCSDAAAAITGQAYNIDGGSYQA